MHGHCIKRPAMCDRTDRRVLPNENPLKRNWQINRLTSTCTTHEPGKMRAKVITIEITRKAD